jgi:DNA-binding LytR/AlgR family response regulator
MNNPKLNILIVEDEYVTQKSIEKNVLLLGHTVKGRAMDYDKAVTILNQEKIDFAIIDINIKGEKNGIEIGTYITNHVKIPFIYLTAYSDQKTISSAIQTEPYGYLVKPFQKHNLLTAIEIALLNFKKQPNSPIDTIIQIKHGDKNIKLNLDAVLFVESEKNYIKIYTGKEVYKYRITLQEFSEKLPIYFIQTHKSFFVNINVITSVSKNILEIGAFKIPISRSFRKTIPIV